MFSISAAEHPLHSRSVAAVHDFGTGRKNCSDALGKVSQMHRGPNTSAIINRLRDLRQKQRKSLWRTHQNVPCNIRGRCCLGRVSRTEVGRQQARVWTQYLPDLRRVLGVPWEENLPLQCVVKGRYRQLPLRLPREVVQCQARCWTEVV